jgi:hypothetical protein
VLSGETQKRESGSEKKISIPAANRTPVAQSTGLSPS